MNSSNDKVFEYERTVKDTNFNLVALLSGNGVTIAIEKGFFVTASGYKTAEKAAAAVAHTRQSKL